MEAEGDVNAALATINALPNKWAPDSPSDLCEVATIPNEQSKVEEELLDLIAQLKERRRITDQPPTLDELLDPKEDPEVCLHLSRR